MQFDLATFLLAIAPLLLAITLHEAAHAYAARYWGDNTAEKLGRLTLNPLAHIDLIGTILVPAALLLMQSPFLFGWAKPVPVISRNLRNTRIAWRTIAVAGPLANLAMAFGWALLLGLFGLVVPESFQEPLYGMTQYGISINIVLFTLNMLPILPLDGGRFIDSFLPAKWSVQYQKIEPYGTWIIFFLLMTRLLYPIMEPVISLLEKAAAVVYMTVGSLVAIVLH